MSTKAAEFKSIFGIGQPPAPLQTGRSSALVPHNVIQFNRDRDGNVSGSVRSEPSGYVRLPGLPVVKAPAPGEVATHEVEPGHLLVVRDMKDGTLSVSSKRLGLKANEKAGTFEGTVMPRQEGGGRRWWRWGGSPCRRQHRAPRMPT